MAKMEQMDHQVPKEMPVHQDVMERQGLLDYLVLQVFLPQNMVLITDILLPRVQKRANQVISPL